MNLNTLAWRNLWRHKRRTSITASSIAFGVLLAVTFTGAGDYFYTRMIDAGANMGMGHITVAKPDYNRAPSSKKYLQDAENLRQQLLKVDGVSTAFSRIQGQAMFASARKNIGGGFIAVDINQETAANNLFIKALIKGRLPDADSKHTGIILGVDLAKKLELDIGKKVVYTTTDANGEIVSAIARITGLFQTGELQIDGSMALLSLSTAQKIMGYQNDEVSVLAVILNDQRQSVAMRDRLRQQDAFKQVEVLNWEQTQPDLAGMITVDKSTNKISQLMIALLVAAGILNTMLMSVLERMREFGVMMAVGMSPKRLFILVMLESFWLAVIGLIIGIIVTTPWYIYMSQTGIDLSGAYGEGFSFGGVLMDPTFKLRLFGESIIAILIGLFGLALLSGAYPAWRAGRVTPVETLKTL